MGFCVNGGGGGITVTDEAGETIQNVKTLHVAEGDTFEESPGVARVFTSSDTTIPNQRIRVADQNGQVDFVPGDNNCTKLTFPNGTLSDEGSGRCTINLDNIRSFPFAFLEAQNFWDADIANPNNPGLFNAVWSPSGGAAYAINSTIYNSIVVDLDADESFEAAQDISGLVAGGDAFNLTIAFDAALTAAEQFLALELSNAAISNRVRFSIIRSLLGTVNLRAEYGSGLTNHFDVSLGLPMYFGPVLLRIQRDGSNNWKFYFSMDGRAWSQIGGVLSRTFTIERERILVDNNGATTHCRQVVEFLRGQWLTLP